MKIFIIALFFAGAAFANQNWQIDKSKFTYTVKYTFKTVHGESTSAKGKIQCDAKTCEYLIAIPVKSFDSGDSNRDIHMMSITKGEANPMVSASGTFATELLSKTQATIPASVNFAGAKKDYTIPVNLSQKPVMKLTGVIPLVLTDFKIELPSLLGINIDDKTPVDFEIELKQAL